MSWTKKIAYALVVLSFIVAAYFYQSMPDRVASHWDAAGRVNGYMGKAAGLFIMPVIALVLIAIFELIPHIDPLRKNFAAFKKQYEGMIAVILGFLFYVYLLTIAYNLGYSFNMTQALAPAFAVLLFYMGIVIGKAKQNWFVGIRTPWTLSSERVWDKTHAVCSKMFKAAGIVALLGIVMPFVGLIAAVAVLIATAVFAFVYSYLEYRKEKKEGKKGRKK